MIDRNGRTKPDQITPELEAWLVSQLGRIQQDVLKQLAEVVRSENLKLLQRHVRPLMSIDDLARTLGKSKRWVETAIRTGEVPPPLWIGGTRRWHPDAVEAFLRTTQGKKRSVRR